MPFEAVSEQLRSGIEFVVVGWVQFNSTERFFGVTVLLGYVGLNGNMWKVLFIVFEVRGELVELDSDFGLETGD